MSSMEGNYSVFIKNNEFDQTKEIQKQFDENEIDYPSKLNVVVSNSDQSRSLRTSKRITSYLLRDLMGDKGSKINSFEELTKRINTSILENIRKTNCISDVTVEGEFQNQINKYQYESLDLKFRLTEDPIFDPEFGLSIDQKQRNMGIILMPKFTNLFGQCETIVFRLRKSYFDFNKETKIFSSFTFPFFSPDSFLQEYEFGMSNRQALNDLRMKMFKLRGTLYSQKDPRWKFAASTTSHHFIPDINSNNVIAEQGSIFDQTMQTYQNLVLKTTFTDRTQTQSQFNTTQTTQISAKIGVGSNQSVFAKAKYHFTNQKIHELKLGDAKINAMAENRFQAGFILAKENLHFTEKFTLVNQPSYKNIDLNDKTINSTTYGSKFFLSNQFKYYFLRFPFLQKINVLPFLHAYGAFVPTNMDNKNSVSTILKQNLRLSAGIGLTYEINDFDKVDFIYSFADFIPKDKKDQFCKFQLNFYS